MADSQQTGFVCGVTAKTPQRSEKSRRKFGKADRWNRDFGGPPLYASSCGFTLASRPTRLQDSGMLGYKTVDLASDILRNQKFHLRSEGSNDDGAERAVCITGDKVAVVRVKGRERRQRQSRTANPPYAATLHIFKDLVGDLPLAELKPSHTDVFVEAMRVWPSTLPVVASIAT